MVLQKHSEAKRVYASIIQCRAQARTPMARGNRNKIVSWFPLLTFVNAGYVNKYINKNNC